MNGIVDGNTERDGQRDHFRQIDRSALQPDDQFHHQDRQQIGGNGRNRKQWRARCDPDNDDAQENREQQAGPQLLHQIGELISHENVEPGNQRLVRPVEPVKSLAQLRQLRTSFLDHLIGRDVDRDQHAVAVARDEACPCRLVRLFKLLRQTLQCCWRFGEFGHSAERKDAPSVENRRKHFLGLRQTGAIGRKQRRAGFRLRHDDEQRRTPADHLIGQFFRLARFGRLRQIVGDAELRRYEEMHDGQHGHRDQRESGNRPRRCHNE